MDRPAEVDDLSRAKVEIMRQEKKTANEANFGKAAMPKEKVPVDAPFCLGYFSF